MISTIGARSNGQPEEMTMEIKNVEKQKTLMIRMTAPAAKLPEVMGEVYGELGAYLGRKGIAFAGAPYAMYYNMDMDALDVEMGFPVVSDDKGEGRIRNGEIPAGKVASTVHVGPYAKLEDSYSSLMAFVKEKGLNVTEWMYEYYLNSPVEVKEEELRTEICYPIR